MSRLSQNNKKLEIIQQDKGKAVFYRLSALGKEKGINRSSK
jgi:hypothetical protein